MEIHRGKGKGNKMKYFTLNGKEYKEFYLPKNKAQIVTMPRMNYIAVRGKGNPNEEIIIKLYNTSLRSNVTYRKPLYISSTTMI